MILGKINQRNEALIPLLIVGANKRIEIQVVIDTGFSGILTLPPILIAELNLVWKQQSRAMMADGSISQFDQFAATILWDGIPRQVLVESVDTAPLVGMRLLNGYELTMQVVPNGNVQLQRLLRGE